MSLQMPPFPSSAHLSPLHRFSDANDSRAFIFCFLAFVIEEIARKSRVSSTHTRKRKTSSWWTRVELAKKNCFPIPVRLTCFTMANRFFLPSLSILAKKKEGKSPSCSFSPLLLLPLFSSHSRALCRHEKLEIAFAIFSRCVKHRTEVGAWSRVSED